MASCILPVYWLWLIVGIFLGSNIGFVVFAILNAGHRADETDRIRRRLDQASRGGHDHA